MNSCLAPSALSGTLTRAFAGGANFAQSCDCIQIRTANERETRDVDGLIDLVDQNSSLTAEETAYFGCIPPELICYALFVEARESATQRFFDVWLSHVWQYPAM